MERLNFSEKVFATASLAWILLLLAFWPLMWPFFIYLIAYTTLLKYIAICYLLWMYVDKESCERGGRRWEWYRRLKVWDYYRDYFPVNLVKTSELPPDRNYLFATYPHGILPSGAFAAFATESLNFERLFKGIKSYVCTLRMNFYIPIIRDFMMAQGLVAVSRSSLNWLLSNPEKGKAAVLIAGGATEAMCNKPGFYQIVLRNRKGFCRIALENGSPLVPVFSFGENDLFDQIIPKQNSWKWFFQKWVKKVTGIAPILFGLIPKRIPITVVVGEPIEVEQVKNPTEKQVEALHEKFTKSVIHLFNSEKQKYLENSEAKLIIT